MSKLPVFIALLLFGFLPTTGATQEETAEIAGISLPVQVKDGTTYVLLETLKEQLSLEVDRSVSGAFRVLGHPPATRDVAVEFWPGETMALVDGVEVGLGAPTLPVDGGVLVPLADFKNFLSAAPDAAGTASPSGDAVELMGMAFEFEAEWTLLRYVFDKRPNYEVSVGEDGLSITMVMVNSYRGFVEADVLIQSQQVSSVTFETPAGSEDTISTIYLEEPVEHEHYVDDDGKQVFIKISKGVAKEGETFAEQAIVGEGKTYASMDQLVKERPVIIDAGHGGADKGITHQGMPSESELALDFSKRVAVLLEKGGFKAVLTRTDDTDLSMVERLDRVHAARPGLLVSMHADASLIPADTGARMVIASRPRESSSKVPGADMRGAFGPSSKEVEYGIQAAQDMGGWFQKLLGQEVGLLQEDGCLPVSRALCPGLVVELGFYTNAADRRQLASSDFLDQAAYGVYCGIFDYYTRIFERTRRPGATPLARLPPPAFGADKPPELPSGSVSGTAPSPSASPAAPEKPKASPSPSAKPPTPRASPSPSPRPSARPSARPPAPEEGGDVPGGSGEGDGDERDESREEGDGEEGTDRDESRDEEAAPRPRAPGDRRAPEGDSDVPGEGQDDTEGPPRFREPPGPRPGERRPPPGGPGAGPDAREPQSGREILENLEGNGRGRPPPGPNEDPESLRDEEDAPLPGGAGYGDR